MKNLSSWRKASFTASVHKRGSCAVGSVGDSSVSQSGWAGKGGTCFMGRGHQQSQGAQEHPWHIEKFSINRFVAEGHHSHHHHGDEHPTDPGRAHCPWCQVQGLWLECLGAGCDGLEVQWHCREPGGLGARGWGVRGKAMRGPGLTALIWVREEQHEQALGCAAGYNSFSRVC